MVERVPNQMTSVLVGFSWRRFDEHHACTAPTQFSMFLIDVVTEVTGVSSDSCVEVVLNLILPDDGG